MRYPEPDEEVVAEIEAALDSETAYYLRKLDLLTTTTLAKVFGLEWDTLKRWRTVGKGPAYIVIGKRVWYRLRDVEDWIMTQRRDYNKLNPHPDDIQNRMGQPKKEGTMVQQNTTNPEGDPNAPPPGTKVEDNPQVENPVPEKPDPDDQTDQPVPPEGDKSDDDGVSVDVPPASPSQPEAA